MTRAQRRAHALVFRVLAALLLAAIGFAFVRRSVARDTEAAALGHTRVHDADGATP